MKNAAYSILLLLVIAGAFLAGSWYSQRGAVKPNPGAREIVQHMDSTRSVQTPAAPAMAPASGTPPGPVHVHGGPANPGGGSATMSAGTVKISPAQQQLIGVRVSPVEKSAATHTLRLFGRVAPDETRIYRLYAGVDGFIRQVSTVTTGSQVEKDQWLATFSAPESRSPIQAYLVTLGVLDRSKQSGTETPAQADAANQSTQLAIDRLLNLGMSMLQIEEIRRTRQVATDLKILAPADGFVLARNVSPGQKFEKGAEWFRIADLGRVWILADAFENEAQYLRPGVRSQASLTNQRKTLPAQVGEVLPQFDAATRTLKVRLEADNPGYILRPDMFVDVELPVAFAPTIAVPADAVLDSGLRKTVFVDRGEGLFEPRQVETGWRFGDRVEIVKGLTPGERIVVSGTFLLDSESRMRPAAAPIGGTPGKAKAVHTGDEQGARGHGGHQP